MSPPGMSPRTTSSLSVCFSTTRWHQITGQTFLCGRGKQTAHGEVCNWCKDIQISKHATRFKKRQKFFVCGQSFIPFPADISPILTHFCSTSSNPHSLCILSSARGVQCSAPLVFKLNYMLKHGVILHVYPLQLLSWILLVVFIITKDHRE